jgi:hypothetical protein
MYRRSGSFGVADHLISWWGNTLLDRHICKRIGIVVSAKVNLLVLPHAHNLIEISAVNKLELTDEQVGL